MSSVSMSSEDLFSPSSPPPRGNEPDNQPENDVPILAQRALIVSMAPFVNDYVETNKTTCLAALRRQIEKILSRPQAIERGRVTVYDKVLLFLTNNGADLENESALQYFVEEFLGVDVNGDPEEAESAIDQGFRLRMAAIQVNSSQAAGAGNLTSSQVTKGGNLTSSNATRHTNFTSSQMTGGSKFISSQTAPLELFPKTHSQTTDPKLIKIWAVYESAKKDYLEKSDTGHSDTLIAAKFLRDTAENILLQLQGQNVDGGEVQELTATFNMAKAMVVSLTGGKKRKFDPVGMENVRGVPRGPSNLTKAKGCRGNVGSWAQREGGRDAKSPGRFTGYERYHARPAKEPYDSRYESRYGRAEESYAGEQDNRFARLDEPYQTRRDSRFARTAEAYDTRRDDRVASAEGLYDMQRNDGVARAAEAYVPRRDDCYARAEEWSHSRRYARAGTPTGARSDDTTCDRARADQRSQSPDANPYGYLRGRNVDSYVPERRR